jgi:hypothetical protein
MQTGSQRVRGTDETMTHGRAVLDHQLRISAVGRCGSCHQDIVADETGMTQAIMRARPDHMRNPQTGVSNVRR